MRNTAVLFALSIGTRSHQVKEEVKNNGFDFKSIGAGSDAIVVEQFGGLALFDVKSGDLNRSRFAWPAICPKSAAGW